MNKNGTVNERNAILMARRADRHRPQLKYLIVMKLTLFLCLAFSVQAMGNAVAQQVNLQLKNKTLGDVFKEIRKQTGYAFLYTDPAVSKSRLAQVNFKNTDLRVALDEIFDDQSYTYQISGKVISILPKSDAPQKQGATKQQTIDVYGVVLDSLQQPMGGVTVHAIATGKQITTDKNGRYELKGVPAGSKVVFRSLGYTSQELQVKQAENNIRMRLMPVQVEEVAVSYNTGYQNISKERATGSYGIVTANDLKGKLQDNILERIEGQVAGLTSYKGTMQVRGKSTLSGVSSPLYVVDGIPYEGSLDAINPSEIAQVTVLKDATAASIYGARSANGVIVINTRSGAEGPVRIALNSSMKWTPLPDPSYNNLLSSSEFIDFQQQLFKLNPGTMPAGYYVNEVRQLFFDHAAAKINDDELEQQLNVYRARDRRSQLQNEFLRSHALDQQHNLSFSGGTAKHKYALSGNYMKSAPYEKAQTNDRIGYNFKNTLDITKWLRMETNLIGSFTKADYDNGFLGMSVYNGSSKASYLTFRDENGDALPWYQAKSQTELNRLTGLGLLDESYYPMDELERQHYNQKDNYHNLNLGLNFKLMTGLTLDLRYQKEIGNGYSKQFYGKDSWFVRNMINNATQIKDGNIIQNIPTGGQIKETRSDRSSHTLRAQLNYNESWNDLHEVYAIAGAEQRKVRNTGTTTYRVGYDDHSLSYKAIDEKSIARLTGTEALGGSFSYSNMGSGFTDVENRYVSFYGNGSYTYNKRLTVNASIRMDQSNLFGTDPKYQYRPLWSLGTSYHIFKDPEGWLDRLSVRATHGINGNIAKMSGPFLTVFDSGINDYINEPSSQVTFPPNSGLRWEKTHVTNFGVDFSILKSVLHGSIDLYNKNTTDLLRAKVADPTYGWSELTLNYGDMYNRGIEVNLNSTNIKTAVFSWQSMLNFSYNKNKLTRIENTNGAPIYYIQANQIREDKPLNGLYAVRWAGLDELGAPQAYNAKGEITKSFATLAVDDLVYAGTTLPPYATSFSNYFQYRNFDLSFMFVHYGGHVMRGIMGDYIVGTGISANVDRQTANFWTKPGDELDPEKAPAFKQGASANMKNIWVSADKHIEKADYIKLRDISLSYTLPSKILDRYKVSQARVTAQVQNPWRWSANSEGLDPEVWNGTSTSPTRGTLSPTTYTLGVSLNF